MQDAAVVVGIRMLVVAVVESTDPRATAVFAFAGMATILVHTGSAVLKGLLLAGRRRAVGIHPALVVIAVVVFASEGSRSLGGRLAVEIGERMIGACRQESRNDR